jgi:hypothetical protein
MTYEDFPVEELLRLTQSNVTPDPDTALEIAKVAYSRADNPIEKSTAARQAGFRAEQAGDPPEAVSTWFEKSREALELDQSLETSERRKRARELIATHLLAGRAFALRVERSEERDSSLVGEATAEFTGGQAIVRQQHKLGNRWDRFGTMLSRHWSAHEAMNGKATTALKLAFSGMWRAVRADKEGVPEKDHFRFVAKHVGANALAAVLAGSQPLAQRPKVAEKRHRLALKLLG